MTDVLAGKTKYLSEMETRLWVYLATHPLSWASGGTQDLRHIYTSHKKSRRNPKVSFLDEFSLQISKLTGPLILIMPRKHLKNDHAQFVDYFQKHLELYSALFKVIKECTLSPSVKHSRSFMLSRYKFC